MTDAVIEKVRAAIKQAARDGKPLAEAALAALEPGDDLGGGLKATRTLAWAIEEGEAASVDLEAVAEQARAEEREAIAARLEKDAETFTEPTKTVLLVKAAAIRGRGDD